MTATTTAPIATPTVRAEKRPSGRMRAWATRAPSSPP